MNKQEALNKIAELQKYIEGIDKKKEYRPRAKLLHEVYHHLNASSEITYFIDHQDEIDNWNYLTGNYFLSKEEAEQYRDYLKALGQIRNYIKENDLWFEPDWGDSCQEKYYPYYNVNENEWCIDQWRSLQYLYCLPYLQSEKHTQRVIDNCLPQLEIVRKWHEKNL